MTTVALRSLVRRFWLNVEKHETGCWGWKGGISNQGYAVLGTTHGKAPAKAHRLAWFLRTGKWPTKDVLHTCDNPPCTRFDHLYEGTDLENARDREVRGRGNQPKGEHHRDAILNEAKVRIIRATNFPDRVWAERFGVSLATVQHARTGLTWQLDGDGPGRPERRKYVPIGDGG